MQSASKCLILFLTVLIGLTGCVRKNRTRLVTYPPTPVQVTSDLYAININDQDVWTEKYRTEVDLASLPGWFVSRPYTQVQQEVHMANLSCDGPLTVRVEMPDSVSRAVIHPLSRGIEPVMHGTGFEFVLPGPDKLYIEVDSLPPLLFFANPLESDLPDPGEPGMTYFGPGIHEPGMMTLKDGDVLYLAGGAVVYGGIRAAGVSHIKIFGRGILDGDLMRGRMILMEDCNNVEFNGIMIRKTGGGWTNTLVNCTHFMYKDVKVISFGPGGDGINPLGSRHFIIEDCFLRCTDDCIAIKSPDSAHVVQDIQVRGNTMVGYAFSDGVTIGFETNGPSVSDVFVRNCDVIMARGGSRVDGHSAFSIICDGPATIHNILYENIRVEAPVFKLFELHITDGTKYGINPPGHIQHIRLKDIAWSSERPIILQGFDENHWVKDVTFENCTIQGEPLTEMREDLFQVNDFVEGVTFK
jgi:hypothetical protein